MATVSTPYGPVQDGFELSTREAWARESLIPLVRGLYTVASRLNDLTPAARVHLRATGDDTYLKMIANGRETSRHAADYVYSLMPSSVIEGGDTLQAPRKALVVGVLTAIFGLVIQLWAWVKLEELVDWWQKAQGEGLDQITQALTPATVALVQANGDEARAAEILKSGLDVTVINPVAGSPSVLSWVFGGALLAGGIYVTRRLLRAR